MILHSRQVTSPTGTWVEVRNTKAPEISYVRVRWNLEKSPLENHFKGVKYYLLRKEGIKVPADIPPTAFHFVKMNSTGITWVIHESQLQSYFYGGTK